MIKKMVAILLVLIVLVSVVGAEPQYPRNIIKYVTDTAQLFTPDQTVILNDQCAAIEQKYGVEIAIITVQNTGGQDVITYAAKTGELNGVGKESTSDGIVLLLSLDNIPGYAIATGRGSEFTVTDAYASRFARNAEPYLNSGNYYQGFVTTLTDLDGLYNKTGTVPVQSQKSGMPSYAVTGLTGIAIAGAIIIKKGGNK